MQSTGLVGIAGFTLAQLLFLNLLTEFWLGAYVRGSRQRYIVATIRRAIGWNWVVNPIVNSIHVVMSGESRLWLIIYVVGLVIGTWMARIVYSDDEDDWFSGKWTRLKKRLSDAVSSLTPSTLPHPA